MSDCNDENSARHASLQRNNEGELFCNEAEWGSDASGLDGDEPEQVSNLPFYSNNESRLPALIHCIIGRPRSNRICSVSGKQCMYLPCLVQYQENLRQAKPLPPNAAAMFKVLERPIGTFTGAIPISFPLCDIPGRRSKDE
jgi:hypothetical protein